MLRIRTFFDTSRTSFDRPLVIYLFYSSSVPASIGNYASKVSVAVRRRFRKLTALFGYSVISVYRLPSLSAAQNGFLLPSVPMYILLLHLWFYL